MKICEGLDIPQADRDAFNGWCVAYFQHEALIGTVCRGELRFVHEPNWAKLLEFHLFNETVEHRALRRGDGFVLRTIEDPLPDEEDGTFPFDEEMMVIGSDGVSPASEQEFVTAGEKGKQIALPPALAGLRVVIRNYMTFSAVDEETMPGCETMHLKDWRYAGFREESKEAER